MVRSEVKGPHESSTNLVIYSKVECHDKNQSNLVMYSKKNGTVRKDQSW